MKWFNEIVVFEGNRNASIANNLGAVDTENLFKNSLFIVYMQKGIILVFFVRKILYLLFILKTLFCISFWIS